MGLVRSAAARLGLEALVDDPTSNAAKSLINQNYLNIAQAVGMRNLSDFESRTIMQVYGTLAQTPAGLQFAATNQEIEGKAEDQEYKIYNQILKENKNLPPADILQQVEAKMEPHRQKYKKEFDENLAKVANVPVPNADRYPVGTRAVHPITNQPMVIAQDQDGKKYWSKADELSGQSGLANNPTGPSAAPTAQPTRQPIEADAFGGI